MIRAILLLLLLAAPAYTQRNPVGSADGAANQRSDGYVRVGTARLYYEETGKGEAVILIHGGLLDRRMWDPQFDTLGKDYRVIRYDVRNHGLSRTLPDTFSNHEDLNRLMEGLGIGKAVLVGLSMGGAIAIDFALTYPEKVAALLPVSSGLSGYEFKDPENRENERKMREAMEKSELDSIAEYFQRSWTDGPRRTPGQVDRRVRGEVRGMLMGTMHGWKVGAVERTLAPPAIGRLGEIHVPTFAIVGDLDMPAILEIAGLLEANVAGAKKAVIKGAAHMVNMEKPQEFNALLLGFLAGLPRH
jgi:pimeloyl-ACP methyl ester carboxylesterase